LYQKVQSATLEVVGKLRPALLTLSAGLLLALIAAQSLGWWPIKTSDVTVFAPFSLPIAFLAFTGGDPPCLPLIVAVPSVVFWLWSPGLFRGKAVVPIRSVFLFAISVVISAEEFVGGWGYGLRYQGFKYTITTALLSTALAIFTGILILRLRRAPSFALNLLTHFVLFAWLITYAFPYLGELP
jgi:hypothetical protein